MISDMSGWVVTAAPLIIPLAGSTGSDRRPFYPLLSIMRDAGYATCVVGKWQLGDGKDGGRNPAQAGFDKHFMKIDSDSKEGQAVLPCPPRLPPQLRLAKQNSGGRECIMVEYRSS